MSYRPITDFWFLTRAKLKPNADGSKNFRYGCYLGGFPERARRLIGCAINEPMLHLCGGLARLYPYDGGFGPLDETLDNDAAVEPDFLLDAEGPLPVAPHTLDELNRRREWGGILIDPPYTEEDAKKYPFSTYPNPNLLVANSLAVLPAGRKVGIIHYVIPRCPTGRDDKGNPIEIAKFIACVGVACGFGNRIRCFSVFEKL
jgi:hypothetical protein